MKRRTFLKKIKLIIIFPFLKYYRKLDILKIKKRWLFKIEDI